MAKFKGRIIFEVKFKDMHIPLFAMDNIVQKVALHKCAQQIEFWHKMEFHEKKKHLYQKNIFVGTRIVGLDIDNKID